MTEQDAFEVRLEAAVRGYAGRVSSGLDPIELARRIAAAAPRRRGFAAALGWRTVAIPRAVWPLLLLGALLTALVAGLLVAGSQPAPRLPALVPPVPAVVPPVGPAFACPPVSTPDTPGPVDQARPVDRDGIAAMVFDRQAGKIALLAQVANGTETWTFDVCTNTWTRMHPSREPSSVEGADLVYDIDSDATILVAYGADAHVWVYDLGADTWTERGAAPTYATSLAYDAVTGLVVATAGGLLWSYEVETDTWTQIHQANAGPEYDVIAYDVSVDRLVAYGDETWLFDIRTGIWSRSGAEMPAVVGWLVAPGIVYDEAAERTVIFRRGPLTAYDATAYRWEILAEAETPVGPNLMVYDPVNRRLVGWGDQTWGPTGAVAALDLMTGEWTVLLEPSEGQPTTSSK